MLPVGIVYYADDADRRVFRMVYLSPGDDVLVLSDPRWVTEGCDPARRAVLEIVAGDDPRLAAGMTGTA